MLLPAGRSESGQILHPEPIAVSSHHCPPTKCLCGISGRGRDKIQCKAAPDVLTELCRSRGLPCSARSGEGSLESFPPSVDISDVCFQTSQDDPGSFPDCYRQHRSSAFSAGIVSLSGNSLLLLVAYQKRSMLKPAEFFIVNLAVSDLSMTVTLFPLATSSFFAHRYLVEVALHWPAAPGAVCELCLEMGRSLTGVHRDPGSQSGGTGARCTLTDIHPTAGCFAVPCPSGLSHRPAVKGVWWWVSELAPTWHRHSNGVRWHESGQLPRPWLCLSLGWSGNKLGTRSCPCFLGQSGAGIRAAVAATLHTVGSTSGVGPVAEAPPPTATRRAGWEAPSLPAGQGPPGRLPPSRVAGAVRQPPRAEGKGRVSPQAFPCRWLFNQAVCTLYAFCGVLFGLCSLTSLTVLSTVCCLKVCYPAYGRCWDALSDLYLHPSLLT